MTQPRYPREDNLEAGDGDDGNFCVAYNCSDSDARTEGSLESEGWSLTSSVFDYLYVNGRRYQNFRDGFTLLPNDEVEQDRLDLYHHLQLMLRDGALHLAPINTEGNKVKRILDVGTGTGIWAIDMADKYSDAEIVGVDLSPIQPTWVPPNLRFEIDDVENPWTFTRNFDFIHIRGLAGSILDWPKLLQQAYRYLKPGGYIEVSEHDFQLDCDDEETPPEEDMPMPANANIPPTMSSTPSSSTLPPGNIGVGQKQSTKSRSPSKVTAKMFHTCNVTEGTLVVLRMKELLEAAGFTNVKRVAKKLPWGAWPRDRKFREIGAWTMLVLESGLEAYGMQLMTKALGMTTKEVTELVERVKEELNEKKLHVFTLLRHILYAQKPFRIPDSAQYPHSSRSEKPDRPDAPVPPIKQEEEGEDDVLDDGEILAGDDFHGEGLLLSSGPPTGDGVSVLSD